MLQKKYVLLKSGCFLHPRRRRGRVGGQSQVLDSVTTENRQITEGAITILHNDLRTLDSLWSIGATISNVSARQQPLDSILAQRNQMASLLQLRTITEDSLLTIAGNKNNQVLSIVDPEANQKVINSAEIALRSTGMTALNGFTSQLISIASQCPYKGGPAVYKARTLLDLLEAGLNYDDAITCAAQGVFRGAEVAMHTTTSIQIQPNPAINQITITVNGKISSNYHLRIYDSKSVCVFKTICRNKVYEMNISNFNSGVYSLQIVGVNEVWIERFIKLP